MENTSPTANLFCTNCGKPVAEHAIACMSCGAKPTGHKKFCRHCGVTLNPEQVVCIKCGAAIKTTFGGVANPLSGFNVGGMTISDVIILVAATAALISFLLPWFQATIPVVGAVSKSGFSGYAFWLVIAFIYPAWMALAGLAGKDVSIDKVSGFVCAGLGFVVGLAHSWWMYEKEFSDLSKHEREMIEKFASFGAGTYLFLCACIVLAVGVALTTRSSSISSSNTFSAKPAYPQSKILNLYFWMFGISMIAGTFLCMSLFLLPLPLHPMLIITLLAKIAGIIFLFMLLYRLWQLVPAEIARTTPGKAVGFCFIPLFNFYWAFVAFKGLSIDMNKTLQQRGIQYRISDGWLTSFLWAVTWTLFLINFYDILCGSVLYYWLLYCFALIFLAVVAFFFLKSAKNGAIALLEHQ